jgi:WD40 repeat protein
MRIAVLMIAILTSALAVLAQEQDNYLTLIRKVQVDPLGTLGAVDGCEFSKDGKMLSASDNHGVCRIYRVSDGKEVGKVTHNLLHNKKHHRDGEINAVPFSYDGQYLCTGRNRDGTKVWRTNDWGLEKHLINNAETDGITFSPNKKWLAAAANSNLNIYSLPNFELIKSINHGKRGAVNSISFSPDSSMVAYACSDGRLRILKTDDWKLQQTFSNHSNRSLKSTRFSPDGKYLAYSGGRQSCLVRQVSDWTVVADLVHKGNMKALPGDDNDSDVKVEAVAWSKDGDYLFSSGVVDGVMRVWRSADWSLLTRVQAQEKNRAIEFIDVSIDNKVVVGGDEGVIYIYQFRPSNEKGNPGTQQSPAGDVLKAAPEE